ncbi:hypothetical protein AOLI_G00011360 [Acnodon oligacanthus]
MNHKDLMTFRSEVKRRSLISAHHFPSKSKTPETEERRGGKRPEETGEEQSHFCSGALSRHGDLQNYKYSGLCGEHSSCPAEGSTC